MSNLRLITMGSLAELRAAAAPWDRLWQCSAAVLPTSRAELLALWIEHFAPRARLRLLAVEQGERWIAALPLIGRCWLPGWEVAELPGNHWTPAGDLLLDSDADGAAALDVLVGALRTLPPALLHFAAIDTGAARWQQWLAALERQGVAYSARPRIEIPLARLGDSWSAYAGTLSRNHRRQHRRVERLADNRGKIELRLLDRLGDGEVAPALRRAFEVEHRNWKGRGGTSVLSVPGAFDFFLAQARQLARQGQLLLAFLEHDGQPIAFEYGWLTKRVYQALKIGYDDAYAGFSPGQLIRWRLFERLHARHACRAIDFLGPRTRATETWANDAYVLSRVLAAPRRLSGRWALAAYRCWRARSRQDTPRESPSPLTQPAEPAPAGAV